MAGEDRVASLEAQIAALTAQKVALQVDAARKAASEEYRKRRTLAPGSPSPRASPAAVDLTDPRAGKKARIDADVPGPHRALSRPIVKPSTGQSKERLTAEAKPGSSPCCEGYADRAGPSTFRQALQHAQTDLRGAEDRRAVKRSSTFAAAPAVREPTLPSPVGSHVRDDDLRLVEDLKPGPRHFTAPDEDPDWQQVEPNSRIRLKYVAPSRLG